MKRIFAGTLCAAILGSAQAGDALRIAVPAETPPALEANLYRRGYAFDQPGILIRQRLFGLAHGLSMLAAACLDLPEHSMPVHDAYAAWYVRQGQAIETIVHDLSDYYFGPRAAEAHWPDLSHALNLGDSIEPALGEVSLSEACASLPAAIVQPHYRLDELLTEASAPINHSTTAATVPPAPTIGYRAE